MSSKSGLSPPLLPDSEKFDGTNYIEWSESILMACRLCGMREYLDGTIHIPTPTKTTTTTIEVTAAAVIPPAETPWTSTYPSWEEWDARDPWCLIAIKQNVKNTVGLGIKMDGTAADASRVEVGCR